MFSYEEVLTVFLFLLSEYLHDVCIHDKDHKAHEEHETTKKNSAFCFWIHRFSAQNLNEQKQDTSAIQTGNGEQVQYAQVYIAAVLSANLGVLNL